MILNIVWLLMMGGALVCAAANFRLGLLAPAIMEGASKAVSLCITMAGPVCLWSGLLRLLDDSGASLRLERLMSPIARLLLPGISGPCLRAVCANITANLLGMGNAATPAGLKAASLMTSGRHLGMLTVLNSCSFQLIPATAASLRASLGSASPFDILPAVWLCSALSVTAALAAMKLIPGGE